MSGRDKPIIKPRNDKQVLEIQQKSRQFPKKSEPSKIILINYGNGYILSWKNLHLETSLKKAANLKNVVF